MEIDHLHLYVEDAQQTGNWFSQTLGFRPLARRIETHSHCEILHQGAILLVISSPKSVLSPISQHLQRFAPGIVNVAFRVECLKIYQERLKAENLVPRAVTHPLSGRLGISFSAWGSLQHSVFDAETPLSLPSADLQAIDHVVLNVPQGQLSSVSNWYQRLFGWRIQQIFEIETPYSGLQSHALMDASGRVQFNLNEPTSATSQIQTFLNHHRGAGIQHIAFSTKNILETVKQSCQHGLQVLGVPKIYYEQLKARGQRLLGLSRADWEELERLQILLDWATPDSKRLLMQIFSEPLFGVGSCFLEIIERRERAHGFGEGNFQALFEAVEAQERAADFSQA